MNRKITQANLAYKMKNKNKKGALEGETLIKWIIAIVILALCVVLIIIFKDKGAIIISKLKALFMFKG